MIRRVIVKLFIAVFCIMSVSALIGIRIRTYKRDYSFQADIMSRLRRMEENQKQMLTMLEKTSFVLASQVKTPEPHVRSAQPPKEEPTPLYEIDIGDSPMKGDLDAQVVIVEFSDIQCAFSQRFHSVFMQALRHYPKGVKYVFKNFPLPFHQQAKPAAKAALAAGEQGKYWEMLGLLMQSGRELGHEKYVELAQQLQLDVDVFLNDLERYDDRYEEAIQKDLTMGASAAVRGTPTFFINGRKTKARTLEHIKQEIDALLK